MLQQQGKFEEYEHVTEEKRGYLLRAVSRTRTREDCLDDAEIAYAGSRKPSADVIWPCPMSQAVEHTPRDRPSRSVAAAPTSCHQDPAAANFAGLMSSLARPSTRMRLFWPYPRVVRADDDHDATEGLTTPKVESFSAGCRRRRHKPKPRGDNDGFAARLTTTGMPFQTIWGIASSPGSYAMRLRIRRHASHASSLSFSSVSAISLQTSL